VGVIKSLKSSSLNSGGSEDAEDDDDEEDDLMGKCSINESCSSLEKMLAVSSTCCVAFPISTSFAFKNALAETRVDSDLIRASFISASISAASASLAWYFSSLSSAATASLASATASLASSSAFSFASSFASTAFPARAVN
jgi:hypothetical protein